MWLGQSAERPGATPWEQESPHHAGLGYERGAPLPALRAGDDTDAAARNAWLERLAKCAEPKHYEHAYRRWMNSLRGPATHCFTVRALGRVLVGGGNPAATGVGLTLHHTWGVPVLPGSALKGLAASYVQTVYGPEPGAAAPEREPFRGPVWEGSRPVGGPGVEFRRLFGAPDVDGGGEEASAGRILFHDALWVPGKGAMLARDVLTVHQRRYYESGGKQWPGDYDDPNPVSFLTVAPGGRFLVALELAPGTQGGRALLEQVERILLDALREWGLGGKTAAGYGRFVGEGRPAPATPKPLQTPTLVELEAWLEARKEERMGQREQLPRVENEWMGRLLGLSAEERRTAAHLLKRYLKLKREEERKRMDGLLTRLGGGPPSGSEPGE